MVSEDLYIYSGVLHIHTIYSDGTGSVAEVIDAAREARQRWMIITDHDTLGGAAAEGWHQDLLVLVGHEITPVHSHFLALNVDTVISREQPAQAYIDETYQRGGFGIIAHPDDHLDDRTQGPHPWHDWAINRPTAGGPIGIELWNLMSDWRSNRPNLPRPQHFTAPEQTFFGPTPAVLAWWDQLNMQGQRTFGIGGLDAHAFRMHHAGEHYLVFPYFWLFGTLTNYLLLRTPLSSDFATARRQIYGALQQGNSYFVNRLYGDLPSTPLIAVQQDQPAHIGATLRLTEGPIQLQSHLPANLAATHLRLIGNGTVLQTSIGSMDVAITMPGVYRLEGTRKGQPWLYTNPIYILP